MRVYYWLFIRLRLAPYFPIKSANKSVWGLFELIDGLLYLGFSKVIKLGWGVCEDGSKSRLDLNSPRITVLPISSERFCPRISGSVIVTHTHDSLNFDDRRTSPVGRSRSSTDRSKKSKGTFQWNLLHLAILSVSPSDNCNGAVLPFENIW